MAVISFESIIGISRSFNPDSDVLSLSGDASGYRFSASGTNLVVSNASGQSATLTNLVLAQLTNGNVVFSGSTSKLMVGDNTTATANDAVAQAALGALDLVAAGSSNRDANNLIYGMGDGDYISVGSGNNVIFGGSGGVDTADGSDTIVIDGLGTTSGSNLIYGNAGNDTFLFTDPTDSGKNTSVYGGVGADDFVIGASQGTLLLVGGSGVDTINGAGAGGSMTMYGGNAGVDTTDSGDLITSGQGNAVVYGNAGADTLYFDDFPGTGVQTFYAGLGDDTIAGDVGGAGSTGTLTLHGNAGADRLDATSHAGNVTVYGGNGAIDSTDGADSIFVGIGSSAHRATVYANGGNDSITSAAALAAGETLTIYGGAGNDVLNLSGARNATSSVTFFGNLGNDSVTVSDATLTADATLTLGGFELTDILNVTLSAGDATTLVVTGLGSSVSINNTAGNGNYVFTDYTGKFTATNFVIFGGSVLLSNLGGTAGSLTGTANNDQIICSLLGDTVTAGAGNDIVTGGDGADSISGADGNDSITGGEGNDIINAGDGVNIVTGGTGSDSMIGGINNDSISGGNGHDTLQGGLGIDTLVGGNENDTFQYAIAHVDAVDTNVDLITDAFNGQDSFDFSDVNLANLRGTGVSFASGSGIAAQALGANVGMYVATNAAADFSEASIYAALSGIADDLIAGDILYVMISNGVDARLVKITEAANAGTLAAADDTMEFIARMSGTTTATLATLVEGNFADFV